MDKLYFSVKNTFIHLFFNLMLYIWGQQRHIKL